MGSPGVTLTVLDGNLGLQPGSNQNVILVMGCCLGNNAGSGLPTTLYSFGDTVTATNALIGGELLEKVSYNLKAAPGSTVLAMPFPPTTRGGVGSVSHTGPGAMALTPTIAPHGAVTITCTTGGTLGTAAFTFGVTNPITGVTTTSAPVTSAAGWSSTGFLVPGTYALVVFTAGSYISGGSADIYTISTLGVIAHPQGAGPAVPTFTASPVDSYQKVIVTMTLGGAVGTAQFTYSLDNGNSTSAIITTAATYAIPNTGLVLGFSGTSTAGDTYSFQVAGPTHTSTDTSNNNAALQTTYLSQATYSLIEITGSYASAAAWASEVAACETSALALANSNVYVRYIVGGPTVGTVLPNAGSVTVDAADTDSVVIAARAGMSAPHVCVCAGDGLMTSPLTGLQFRRNASWAAAARAVKNAASQDIGAYADGGVASFTSCVRDDFANGGSFYTAGITSLRTYGPGPVFINRGLMGTVSSSDYYPLTNARVVDQGSGIVVTNARQYVLAQIPTVKRGTNLGTVREDMALKIESKVTGAMSAGLVQSSPQNAVAVSCSVVRTNNVFQTGQLQLNASIQPYAYPTTIAVSIGMSLSLS